MERRCKIVVPKQKKKSITNRCLSEFVILQMRYAISVVAAAVKWHKGQFILKCETEFISQRRKYKQPWKEKLVIMQDSRW